MAKVRVQDATKELSTNAAKLMEDISRMQSRTQDVLGSLRKSLDEFAQKERERQQLEKQEELRKQQEAAAQHMTAYSSESVEPAQESASASPEEPAKQ